MTDEDSKTTVTSQAADKSADKSTDKSTDESADGAKSASSTKPESDQPEKSIFPGKKSPPPGTSAGNDDGTRSFTNHLISGLAGGALALLGAILVQNWQPGTNGSNGGTGLDENITSQIASLSEKIKTIETAASGDGSSSDPAALAAFETRLSDLEKTAADLKAELAGLDSAKTSSSSDGSSGPSNSVDLAALSARINDFDTKLDGKISSLRKSITEELKSTTAQSGRALETADFQALKKGLILDQKKSDKKIAQAQAASNKAQQELKSVSESTAGLLAQFEALKSELSEQSQAFAKTSTVKSEIDQISTSLAALASRMDAIGKRENEQRDNARRVLLSLELANLKRAIDNGQPFERELTEMKNLAGDDIDLSALEDYKSGKALTLNTLQDTFRPLVRKILSAAPDKEGGGVLGRILSSAKSIVRVRRTGDIEGDTAEAILARMEQRLKSGDLEAVLTEAKNLKPPADGLAQDWLKQLGARHTIDRSLARLEKHFKSSLTSSAMQSGTNTKPSSDEEDEQ